MRLVCMSDTHNLHDDIAVPDGDVLIHAGDATMRGRPHEVAAFFDWYAALPHKVKLFVPGNHDFMFDRHVDNTDPAVVQELIDRYPSIHILKNKEYTLENGWKVYGYPWVAGLPQWAFGWKSGEGRRAEALAIPPDTNILVSHGPALGVLDKLYGMPLGDHILGDALRNLPNLMYHVHGHIHYSYGHHVFADYTAINAAICDEEYSTTNAPIVWEA